MDKLSSLYDLNFLDTKRIGADVSLARIEEKKGKLASGESEFKIVPYTTAELVKLNDLVDTTEKTRALANLVLLKESKDPNNKQFELIAHSELSQRINAHLARGNKLTFTNVDGSQTTQEVHNFSVRAFTSEEYSSLERALNQFFASVQDARKKTMESKEKGGNEVDYKAQYPSVDGAKIKNSNKNPKDQKKILDPDNIRKTAISIVAKNIAKSATQEKQKQLDQDKEDKIKETELQRSERRQEILNESKENQTEKIAINKEDQKIHAKSKHQKL